MDSSTLLTAAVGAALAGITVLPYFLRHRATERKARQKLQKVAGTEQSVAVAMHPQIDATQCFGCGACVKACPESGVLGVINGRVALIHAAKCVGHGFCADNCPVGAITLGFGAAARSMSLPAINEFHETNVPGIYIVGELSGIGLIKNAIQQGIHAIDHIVSTGIQHKDDLLDAVIVGAGPAGLAAALAAKKHGLRTVLLEQGDIGGTILQYPRRKIVLTSPVELPLYGRLKFTETTKENLLEIWQQIIMVARLKIKTNERVTDIQKIFGVFEITTSQDKHRAQRIVLALGRRGTPRKLGVPGEELSKVAYRLIEAEAYKECSLLVVGGGDSAVEAALALASQTGNTVTLSYRKDEFTRIKERNDKHLQDAIKEKRVQVMLSSQVQEIRPDSVLIKARDRVLEIPNQYVFVFAGGELPYDFLKKTGILLRSEVA